MYYALFCLQNHELMATGRNDTSLKEIKESLLSYLSADHDDKELKSLAKMSAKGIADLYDFEILSQAEKFEEAY